MGIVDCVDDEDEDEDEEEGGGLNMGFKAPRHFLYTKKYIPYDGTSRMEVTRKPLYKPRNPSSFTIPTAQLQVFAYLGSDILVAPVDDVDDVDDNPTEVAETGKDVAIGSDMVCILHFTKSAGTRTTHCINPPKHPERTKFCG